MRLLPDREGYRGCAHIVPFAGNGHFSCAYIHIVDILDHIIFPVCQLFLVFQHSYRRRLCFSVIQKCILVQRDDAIGKGLMRCIYLAILIVNHSIRKDLIAGPDRDFIPLRLGSFVIHSLQARLFKGSILHTLHAAGDHNRF